MPRRMKWFYIQMVEGQLIRDSNLQKHLYPLFNSVAQEGEIVTM